MYAGKPGFLAGHGSSPVAYLPTMCATLPDKQPITRFKSFTVFGCSGIAAGMAFAQLTYRESLRDIETCTACASVEALSHAGSPVGISRNTLAERQSDPGLAPSTPISLERLIHTARRLHIDQDPGLDVRQHGLRARHSSTIDLCLTLLPWAHFRKTKSVDQASYAARSRAGHIPAFIHGFPHGKLHDGFNCPGREALLLPERPGSRSTSWIACYLDCAATCLDQPNCISARQGYASAPAGQIWTPDFVASIPMARRTGRPD